jgi:hypothetical protein
MNSTCAPERLVAWWRSSRKTYPQFPFEISYHHRSDEHSKCIVRLVLEDLIATCRPLSKQLERGEVCYDFDHVIRDVAGGHAHIDLVIGEPRDPVVDDPLPQRAVVTTGIHLALKVKMCMTNYSAARARLRNELADSARSASEQSPQAVVGGLVVVNTSASWISPTDQPDPLPADTARLWRRSHKQPRDAAKVIQMLEQLPRRERTPGFGFDSLGIIAVRHDNELPVPNVDLIRVSPYLPVANSTNYESFVWDISNKYEKRFAGHGDA